MPRYNRPDNSNDPFEIENTVIVKVTQKAICFTAEAYNEEQWVPRSVVHNESEIASDYELRET